MNELEASLVKKCKNGDVNAFEKLITSHEKKVFNLCYRYLNNYDDALELSQEIFLKIFKSIHSFKGESSLYTWIFKIATTTCIDEVKRRNKHQTTSIDEAKEENNIELPDNDLTSNPYNIIENKEIKAQLEKAISELPEEYRTVIILRDIQGFSYNEITEMLNIPLGTIKSRISRARENVKEYITRQDGNFSLKVSSNK